MVDIKPRLTVAEWFLGCGCGLLAATLLMLFLAAGTSSGDDRDVKRKVDVALALAKAEALAKTSVVSIAPIPREAKKDYAAGHSESIRDSRPLVVFISCPQRRVEGAVTSHTDAAEFAGVTGPAVVVGYPVGDRLFVEGSLPCPYDDAKLQLVIGAAAKKIDAKGPAKAMPTAPKPLDWQIRATCPDGRCPLRR